MPKLFTTKYKGSFFMGPIPKAFGVEPAPLLQIRHTISTQTLAQVLSVLNYADTSSG